MDVYGGHMGRSISRFTLVGSAIAVGSLLAGCAATQPGPAVIAQPAAAAAVAAQPAGDYLAGLEQAITNELNAINSTQTDNEPPEVLVELNALSSESSLIQAENFGSLVTTGSNQILKRERLVNALIADVKGNAYLSGAEVNGASVSASILAILERVSAQLQAQASSIESASLVDVLRSVIISIGPSTRVFGLVEPEIHLVVAGGDELQAASILEGQYQTLKTKVSHYKKSSQYAEMTQRLQDLASDVATVTSGATADVEALLALSPAGYPVNRATILSTRAQLTQFRAPLGQLNTAAGDVSEIESLLSQRTS